jgi:hypothetical protein
MMAHADAPPVKTELGYRYSQYKEDDLAPKDVAIGSNQRYDIGVHQFRLLTPVGNDYSVEATFDHEAMSGASPYYVQKSTTGEPQLVMSGASISEVRNDLNVTTTRYYESGTGALSLGYSGENDYKSYNLDVNGKKNINQDMTNLIGGIGISSDHLSPVQHTGFTRIQSGNKTTLNGFAGISQILSAKDIIQTSLSFSRSTGDLSDPYKIVDKRPDSRLSLAWTTAYRRFFTNQDAALHASYRFFMDDWGIYSHTIKTSWQQNIDPHLRLVPSFRYYSQGQADFYTPIDNPADTGNHSSDYRLSPFGAVTLGISAVAHSPAWRLTVKAERYIASGSLALGGVKTSNPALLRYTLLTVGMYYLF